MVKPWQEVTDDELLDFQDSQTGQVARFERIMQKKSIEAIGSLNDRVTGLGQAIYKMHQGLSDRLDKAFEMYEKSAAAQERQQNTVRTLTLVIAIATVLYTGITAISTYATFQANAIQRDALDWQKHH